MAKSMRLYWFILVKDLPSCAAFPLSEKWRQKQFSSTLVCLVCSDSVPWWQGPPLLFKQLSDLSSPDLRLVFSNTTVNTIIILPIIGMASDKGIDLVRIFFFTFPFKREVFSNYWDGIFYLFFLRAVSMVTLKLPVIPGVVIKVWLLQSYIINVIVFMEVLLVKIIFQLKGLLKMKWNFSLHWTGKSMKEKILLQ